MQPHEPAAEPVDPAQAAQARRTRKLLILLTGAMVLLPLTLAAALLLT